MGRVKDNFIISAVSPHLMLKPYFLEAFFLANDRGHLILQTLIEDQNIYFPTQFRQTRNPTQSSTLIFPPIQITVLAILSPLVSIHISSRFPLAYSKSIRFPFNSPSRQVLSVVVPLSDYNKFYTKFIIVAMNCMRELPNEYLDLCPIIDQKYRVLFKLGFGRFSKVKLAINLATNDRVAIKIMNHKIDEAEFNRGYQQKILEMFLNEVKMSAEARHRNVVQIIDFNVGGIYRTADGKIRRILYYVMKIEEYGELFRVINLTEQFTEKTARHIFRQLLSAVRAIHTRRIAHCDIKSENVLLDSKFNLKIVDFGYARYFVDENCKPIAYDNSDGIGSLKCNAPELVSQVGKGTYQGDEIDIFAAGCFLFELVMKAEPFKFADMKDEHYSKIASLDKKKFWDIFNSKINPSSEFKDLVEKMLNPNPKERISLHQVMKHAWINGESVNKDDYKKEMNNRIKKVMVKVRKEQEMEMKQAFMKEKGKKEAEKVQNFAIDIKREIQEKIFQLKNLLTIKDNSSSSHSDSSSFEDYENEEKIAKAAKVEKLRKNASECKKEREDQFRNQ